MINVSFVGSISLTGWFEINCDLKKCQLISESFGCSQILINEKQFFKCYIKWKELGMQASTIVHIANIF